MRWLVSCGGLEFCLFSRSPGTWDHVASIVDFFSSWGGRTVHCFLSEPQTVHGGCGRGSSEDGVRGSAILSARPKNLHVLSARAAETSTGATEDDCANCPPFSDCELSSNKVPACFGTLHILIHRGVWRKRGLSWIKLCDAIYPLKKRISRVHEDSRSVIFTGAAVFSREYVFSRRSLELIGESAE